jgi:K+ transporter
MTTATTTPENKASSAGGSLGVLMVGALGVVYGDIGTSPLYTLKTALEWAGGTTPVAALGMLSLIVWTLLITTSLKYVAVVMRADNDGEGGILALMSLLGIKHGERVLVIAVGVLGAALLYGDGAITPAISVLSALEGLKIPVPQIAPAIVALSAIVLVGLFALQSQGSERIGKLFGPIMTIWFLTIGLLGLFGILSYPGVLVALDPRYGFNYLLGHGYTGFLVLGAVFLCATGAEALYADMGHFGPRPIRLAWYGLVLPCLLLNYAGQTAIVAYGAVGTGANPFFMLCPPALQVPLVALATVATIIASQSIISGAFSMTRQAIQLSKAGWHSSRKRTPPRTARTTRTMWCVFLPRLGSWIGMKSITSPTPSGLTKRVTSTLLSGRYICLRWASWTLAILKKPPFFSSRIAAKMLGESKCGRQHQSIEPSMPTSATVCRSPTTP